MANKSSKVISKIITAIFLIVIIVGLFVLMFSGDNYKVLEILFKNNVTKEEVREALSSLGWKGYLTIGILSMFQVVFTVLPAEPVQVMAGVTFGLLNGSLICLFGVVVGNTLLYILYKIYGQKLSKFFEHNLEFDFEIARKSNKIAAIIILLYFLPAIPYGLICLFTASLNVKYPKYILLTGIGAIPSILIGVGLGHLAIASSWIVSGLVFLLIIAVLVILFKNKSKVFKAINDAMIKAEKKASLPKKASRGFLAILAFGSKIIFDSKNKFRVKREVKRLEKPSLVLCNHGAFVDFVYAGRILRKDTPHFISARLYFYHKKLGKLMRSVGCLPKSMFTNDLENAKNCLKVISNGRVLAMMPEARLSTVGKFEGIQDSTYKFIKKMGVTVYTLTIKGDYLANPKWGDGSRKGGLIEAELKKLFNAGETLEISLEELKERVDSALYYDEFKWLESHPEIKYKKKTLAEGLENILYRCPNCGAFCSLKTNKKTIKCETCGVSYEIDSRYSFVEDRPFKNFADWYDWQNIETQKEILSNPDYKLESKVELRHGSSDGKSFTRRAGKGVCILDRKGLLYKGSRDGEEIEKFFPLKEIYRLLFGAGENFEIYEGREIWYFVPEDKRSSVAWYVVSGILKEIYGEE